MILRRITPEDLTPHQRWLAQDLIARIFCERHIPTGGTRKGDLASIPATRLVVEQRRCFKGVQVHGAQGQQEQR